MKKNYAMITSVCIFLSTVLLAQEVQRELRIFDARSLCREPEVKTSPLPPRPGPLSQSSADSFIRSDYLVRPGPWVDPDSVNKIAAGPFEAFSIGDRIQDFIDEDSWSNVNNSISVSWNCLQFVQTRKVLDQIGRFLENI